MNTSHKSRHSNTRTITQTEGNTTNPNGFFEFCAKLDFIDEETNQKMMFIDRKLKIRKTVFCGWRNGG